MNLAQITALLSASLFASSINIDFKTDTERHHFIVTPKTGVMTYTDTVKILFDDKLVTPETKYHKKTFSEPTEFTTSKIPYHKIQVASQSCQKSGICLAPEITEIKHDIFKTLLTALILGILASFSPCYLPLLPILASQINAMNNKLNGYFFISGVLCANFLLGVSLKVLESSIHGIFSSVAVQISFACILIYMAFVTLGWLRLPITTNKIPESLTPVSLIIMGFASVFVLSPCTTAPLAAAINLASLSTNYPATMFVFGLGSITSLILFLNGFRLLIPKGWYQVSQTILCLLLIFFATKIIISLLGFSWHLSYILTAIFAVLINIKDLKNFKLIILGLILIIGFGYFASTRTTISYEKDSELSNNKLYFISADWCTTCLKIKHNLLTAANIKRLTKISKFAIFDVTNTNKLDQLKKYRIYGPPAWLKISGGKFYVSYGEISINQLLELAKKPAQAIYDKTS